MWLSIFYLLWCLFVCRCFACTRVTPVVQGLRRTEGRAGVTVGSYHVCAGNGIQGSCREWNPGFLQERARAPTNELLLPPVHFKPKREKEKKENVSLEEESGGGGNLHIYSMVICSETLADAWNQTDRSAVCAV